MRYSVHLPNAGPFASPEAIALVATTAERLGYDALIAHDHVNWSYDDRYHFYAGSVESADAVERPTDFYELMTTFSYLAGVTHRIRLIPYAVSLAWRPIALFAREVLTLQSLSGERFILCMGTGNVHKDFEITGTPFEERQRTTLEKLKVLRMLIDQPGPPSFQGRFVIIKDAELTPRPAVLPLWYAGTGDVAMKRAARYAEGWMPAANADFIRRKIPELLQEAQQAGRANIAFEIGTGAHVYVAPTDEEAWRVSRRTLEAHYKGEWLTHYNTLVQLMAVKAFVGSPETVAARVREYQLAGVTYLNLYFIGHSTEALLEQMEVFAKEVIPQVI